MPRIPPYGFFKCTTTVYGFGRSIAAMSSQPAVMRVLFLGFIAACQVKTRSRPSYGAPSDHRIPLRMCSVTVCWSFAIPPFCSVGTSVAAAGRYSPDWP